MGVRAWSSWGDKGGCEQRNEVIVKMHKKMLGRGGGGGGGAPELGHWHTEMK